MTTAAQAIPALEVPAPDDNMDVLSDTAFDFGDGDGDIDLDLDTVPSVHDDDMSLNDAATDGEFDVLEVPADQDDFMADHGDLIEEDDVYNDGDAAAVLQTVDNSAVTFEADMLAPPDEDLIDYSDDEAQQPVKMHSPSVHEEEVTQTSYDVQTTPAPLDNSQENVQTQGNAEPFESPELSHDEAQTYENEVAETHVQRLASPEDQPQSPEPHFDNNDNDEQEHADYDGGVRLPSDEHSHHDSATHETQQEEGQQEAVDDEEIENDERDHDSDQQIELRPVTVNYAGNELWLFKQHDLEENGDFLLEDLSVAKSSISGLFQACRLSLGDDVSGEHEIGFRFDHLHNLELYEDNTACVAVSLERLVGLYHTLQAQDGNEDPECFYITLQFRPRFATLLADVAQYAEQGSGYSALNAAVAAGETHFSNVFSSASTEHDNIEWDDEEIDDEETSSHGSVHSTALEVIEDGGPDRQLEDTQDRENEEENDSSYDLTQQQQSVDLEDGPHQILEAQYEEPRAAQEAANFEISESAAPPAPIEQAEVPHHPESDAAVGEQHASESHDERTPDQIAHDKQEAEDFVDYSDDEDDQEVKSMPAHEPSVSPSSSTVQGDEPTEAQESNVVAEDDPHNEDDVAEIGLDEHGEKATLLTQKQHGDDAHHYALQDYTESYAQGDPFQDFQADGTIGDPFEADNVFNGESNQAFADYDFQEVEGEANIGFDEQPLDEANHGDHVDETFKDGEGATDANAFLDLDHAPEWAIDADPASNLPGEDAVLLHDSATVREDEDGGAVDQPAGTLSTAADLTSTSSNDHKLSSPQGQKRSIDEVGDGIDDAPDSLDAKRPKV